MSRAQRLLSGTAWNLAGQLLPLLVALAAVPWLIRLLGLERFGFLTLAWVLVGYASLLDLGLGRAVVRTMSARLAAQDLQGAADSARTGLSFLLLLGVLAGTLMGAAAPTLVQSVLKVPPALADEALVATGLLALSLPFVMLTSGYTGVLSAHQDFRTLNLIRAGFSVLTYLLPLALALAGWSSLPAAVGAILALRVLGTWAYARACDRRFGLRWRPARLSRVLAAELLSLGGWMSVSNIIGPLLTYLDRLLIGALVPLRSVGLYAAPYDLATRLMVIPYAIVAAVFPEAAAVKPGSPEAVQALRDLGRWLFAATFPALFAVLVFAHPGMALWLGADIGPQAAQVLQILVPGLFLNTMAQAPATLIQAAGRPRDMAVLHTLELPLFLLLLWTLTSQFGIVGTAWAATLRFSLDAIAVFVLAQRRLQLGPWPWRGLVVPAAVAAGLFGAGLLCHDLASALAVLVLGGAGFAVYGWWGVLRAHERDRLGAFVRQVLQR